MSDNQPEPPTPPKAYKNLDFLNSPDARSIRIQCEMEEPATRFKEEGVENTIVFFGSARTPDPETQDTPSRQSRFYADARELAKRLTEWSLQTRTGKNAYSICSGGGPGIMEAANRGAQDAGGRSVALGISLPHEQHINRFSTPELAFEFHYFFIRKYWFLYMAKALVVFPGGVGTMDELFETLTLVQTGKMEKQLPIILYGAEFWNDVIRFEKLVEWGTISPGDINLFKVIDSVDEAFAHITAALGEQPPTG